MSNTRGGRTPFPNETSKEYEERKNENKALDDTDNAMQMRKLVALRIQLMGCYNQNKVDNHSNKDEAVEESPHGSSNTMATAATFIL